MTSDYVPIDCDQHSVLELLALRRTPVVARFRGDDGTPRFTAGDVIDVRTRNGAEYLVLLDPEGGERSIRLDCLSGLSGTNGEPIWRQKTVIHD